MEMRQSSDLNGLLHAFNEAHSTVAIGFRATEQLVRAGKQSRAKSGTWKRIRK